MSRIEFRLHLDSPLRVGTGLPSLTADDTVVRGADDRPIVPSTTIKGAVRSALAALGPEVASDVAMARAFGRSGGREGSVQFTDAVPPAGVEPVVVERTRVSLSERRTARRGRLMTMEAVEPLGRTVEGSLVPLVLGGEALCPDDDAEVLELVALGLAAVRGLGADRSRGLGRVRVAIRRSHGG